MSTEQSAAELFEDDLIKLVMKRLSVRLHPMNVNGTIEVSVILVDNKTEHAALSTGTPLRLDIPELKRILDTM